MGSKRLPSYKALNVKFLWKQERNATSKRSLFKPPSRRTRGGQRHFFSVLNFIYPDHSGKPNIT